MGEVNLEQGTYLVSLARRSIEHYLAEEKRLMPERKDGVLGEKRGVFVTLESFPSHELRGCIGYPLPIKELSLSVAENVALTSTMNRVNRPAIRTKLPPILIVLLIVAGFPVKV